MIDQGIHAGIAGITVTPSGTCEVQLPPLAITEALKFCGAAAGVASTVKTDIAEP